MPEIMEPRLAKKYKQEIAPALKEELGYKNTARAPRVEKVVINMGLGKAVENNKIVESALDDLTRITGQRPVVRRARKSIASFKLREGMPIGASVTLRRDRMYEFMDRLLTIALPRVRDFRGISGKAFDGRGNYSLGVSEQIIFPEIDLDKTTLKGLNITVVTSAKSDKESKVLLEKFGFPFRKKLENKDSTGA